MAHYQNHQKKLCKNTMTEEEQRQAMNTKAGEVMKLITDARSDLAELTAKYEKVIQDLETLWLEINNKIEG